MVLRTLLLPLVRWPLDTIMVIAMQELIALYMEAQSRTPYVCIIDACSWS